MPTIPKQDADSLALMACKSVDLSEKVMSFMAEQFSDVIAKQIQQAIDKALISIGAEEIMLLECDSLATLMLLSWAEIADEVITNVSANARHCIEDAETEMQVALHALRSTADRIETECRKVLPAPAV